MKLYPCIKIETRAHAGVLASAGAASRDARGAVACCRVRVHVHARKRGEARDGEREHALMVYVCVLVCGWFTYLYLLTISLEERAQQQVRECASMYACMCACVHACLSACFFNTFRMMSVGVAQSALCTFGIATAVFQCVKSAPMCVVMGHVYVCVNG